MLPRQPKRTVKLKQEMEVSLELAYLLRLLLLIRNSLPTHLQFIPYLRLPKFRIDATAAAVMNLFFQHSRICKWQNPLNVLCLASASTISNFSIQWNKFKWNLPLLCKLHQIFLHLRQILLLILIYRVVVTVNIVEALGHCRHQLLELLKIPRNHPSVADSNCNKTKLARIHLFQIHLFRKHQQRQLGMKFFNSKFLFYI